MIFDAFQGETVTQITDRALREAELYQKYNFSGVIIENMFDVPYVRPEHLSPHTVTTMTAVALEVRKILTKKNKNWQIILRGSAVI